MKYRLLESLNTEKLDRSNTEKQLASIREDYSKVKDSNEKIEAERAHTKEYLRTNNEKIERI